MPFLAQKQELGSNLTLWKLVQSVKAFIYARSAQLASMAQLMTGSHERASQRQAGARRLPC